MNVTFILEHLKKGKKKKRRESTIPYNVALYAAIHVCSVHILAISIDEKKTHYK
jgi:hypothetical protein